MRKRGLSKQLSRLLLIALYIVQATTAHALPDQNPPYQVKKIYIEPIPGVKEERSLYLKAELEKRGFEIVNDVSQADAVLSLVSAQGEIVLDSEEYIPLKSIYQYQLALPNKQIIWKTRLKFVSKQSVAEEDEYVARKIAGKIAKKFGAK